MHFKNNKPKIIGGVMEDTENKTNIIAIANQKGGVGKTTTTVNLATALAASGKKVLLIDLDPQGNASTGFGVKRSERNGDIYDVICDKVEITEAIAKTEIPDLSLLYSTVNLSAAEIELVSIVGREFILKDKLTEIDGMFDYILIDCPPSLGLLTINALVAANSVLIPLQCEFYALEGLSHLLKTIDKVKKHLNRELKIHGILLTMQDKRNNLSQQVESDVRSYLGESVFETVIPRNIKVSEAPSHGKPAILYDYKCSGSMAYIHLAKEMLHREKITAETAAA
jgi:chromosome partitioning protein